MLSPFLAVLVVLMLNGCTRVQEKLTPAAQPPSCIAPDARVSVPRGIDGLEIGMTPVQIGQLFTIREDQDPVAVLLAKYGKEKEGKALAREDKALQKRFFTISSGVGKLPDGITSADARVTHGLVYEIGLHYHAASAQKISWEDITYSYIAKYGKPSEDTGSGYIWDDGRTRLDIESSGSVINVFFTDKALEVEVKRSERNRR